MLKNIDGSLFQPLCEIYDWEILQQSRDVVFPVFARTVAYAGCVLRAPIVEELGLSQDEWFTYERLGRMYLEQMWFAHANSPFDVCTAPVDAPRVMVSRVSTTFQSHVGHLQRGIEPLVWQHLFNNTK